MHPNLRSFKQLVRHLWVILIVSNFLACATQSDQVSSRAYKGHESDLDANNFVSVYPDSLGTRLDDCQTCHKGDTFTYPRDEDIRSVYKNSCDYCHLIEHPADNFIEPQPKNYTDTLNPYGAAYLAAGRTKQALKDIAEDDSDSDEYGNQVEITDLKYPGDPDSRPGQEVAPLINMTMADLKALGAHTQFLLANSHKQEYDNYSVYTGVKIKDLLAGAGVDSQDANIEGITIIAPDGYMKDFSMDDVNNAFAKSLYYANLDNAGLGTECGFVTYPDNLPGGLSDGGEIPDEQWLQLAYQRDELPMQPCSLDITSGKIEGEGPFRIIVPQSIPGSPDRGSTYSPTECNDGWDYDDSKDHNAGAMVRGVTAIRINPLPAGYEDFDHKNGGWAFIDDKSIIIYGYGIS
ncbi:MAG: hypothetical protein JRJ87_18610, partial [Deltaproteobacteria bacterium]|nr:hypothetical protein [Deltaproteobacteria bacterium]